MLMALPGFVDFRRVIEWVFLLVQFFFPSSLYVCIRKKEYATLKMNKTTRNINGKQIYVWHMHIENKYDKFNVTTFIHSVSVVEKY